MGQQLHQALTHSLSERIRRLDKRNPNASLARFRIIARQGQPRIWPDLRQVFNELVGPAILDIAGAPELIDTQQIAPIRGLGFRQVQLLSVQLLVNLLNLSCNVMRFLR